MQWLSLSFATLLLGLALYGVVPAAANPPREAAKATFEVQWYDVGMSALEGQPGVMHVTKGWRGFKEVNRVVYDPQQITLEQMQQKLKQAGTYRKTVE
jgi:hypothetical protein